MRYGSLFTGIGGFDIALERSGMECVWQCEIDKNCQSLLERYWKGVKRFDDVRSVGKGNAERVDVIVGGFPCQDLSVAGKRKGLAGERSGLWFEFARVIDELEPQWVVIENVPGLLSSNRGRDFAVIVRWLAERGYGVSWRVLDAQYFGVPQRRRRVFIVGSFGDGRSAEVLFEREASEWNSSESDNERQGIAIGIENHPNDSRITITGEVCQQLTGRMGTGGNNVPLIGWNGAQITSPQNKGGVFENVSTTMNGDSRNMVGVRRLTPLECERLQGFPDGWTEGQSDSVRYRQLGNAVAVPVVEWIAKRIAAL